MKSIYLAAILSSSLAVLLSGTAQAYDNDDLRKLRFEKKCNGCDLEGANLQGMSLRGAELRWSNLTNANLNNADLERADLTGSDLSNARISQTRFNSAILQGVTLTGTDISRASFRNADLRWSLMEHLDIDNDLMSLDLMTAKMEGARFRNKRRCGGFAGGLGTGCIPEFR